MTRELPAAGRRDLSGFSTSGLLELAFERANPFFRHGACLGLGLGANTLGLGANTLGLGANTLGKGAGLSLLAKLLGPVEVLANGCQVAQLLARVGIKASEPSVAALPVEGEP